MLAKPDKDIAASVVEAMHLLHNKSISMIVEPSLIETIEINYPDLIVNKNSSGTFISDMPVELYNPKDKTIDLIVTFGGDGLLLHLNTLFNERNIPPVMCFDFGSLGFLSPFYFEDFEEEVIA